MMRKCSWAILGAVGFTLACGSSDEGKPASSDPYGAEGEIGPDGIRNQRTQLPPPPATGRQFLSEEYIIAPGEERQMCVIETYDGPNVGIRSLNTYQTGYGHHVAFLATSASAEEYPDRVPFNCTTNDDFEMTNQVPMFLGTAVGLDGINEVTLPDGMATLMPTGTRVLIQSHYVNSGAVPIRVRDGFNVDFAQENQVKTWVAPFVNTSVTFEVPPRQEHTVEFDCTFSSDLTILYLYGHMHERGARHFADHTPAGGTRTRLYEVEQWLPDFRDQPPANHYGAGEFSIKAGDVLTTSCTWNNDTDASLTLPKEMCVTLGMAYPSREAVMCVK
jgi:hypothetical protein